MKKVLHILEVVGISLFIVAGIVYWAWTNNYIAFIEGMRLLDNLAIILMIEMMVAIVFFVIDIYVFSRNISNRKVKLYEDTIETNFKYMDLLQDEYKFLQEQVDDLNEKIAQFEVIETQDLDCIEDNE